MYFNNSSEPIGLFSSTKNATVKNLTLEDVKSPSEDHSELGSIVGNAIDSNFENISVVNAVLDNYWSTFGGIVGWIKGNTIINQCVSNAKLSGLYAGGVVAFAEGEWSIVDTYSTSEIGSRKNLMDVEAAGLVLSNKGVIKNSYFAGKFENTTMIHPLSESGTQIVNSYFDSDLIGIQIPAEQARTTSQMKQKSNFVDWDSDIWYIEEGSLYPYLKNTASQEEENDLTDSDEDEISDYLEDIITTDKYKKDTDGDGLEDFFELYSALSNPLLVDTDSNGISDAEEDPDSDGLTNIREQQSGTYPNDIDTDGDGLSDFIEINQTKSEPLKKDSDSNGIDDADEYYTISGTYTSEGQAKEKIIPTFEISVLGKNVQPVEVELIPEDDAILSSDIYGYLGKAFRFNYLGGYQSLKVSAEVDPQYITADNKPTLYAQDKENQTFVELENQTITNNVISADVDSTKKYTTFILLNKDMYERTLEPFDAEGTQLQISPASITDDNLDTVILLQSHNPVLFEVNKEIIIKTLDTKFLSENNRFAIVVFGKNYFSILNDFTNDRELLKNKIKNLSFQDKGSPSSLAGEGLAYPIEKVFNTMLSEDSKPKNIFLFLDSFEYYSDGFSQSQLIDICSRYNSSITLVSDFGPWIEMMYDDLFNIYRPVGRAVVYNGSPAYYMGRSSYGVTKENASTELTRYLKKDYLDTDGDKLPDFIELGINSGAITMYGKKIVKGLLLTNNKHSDTDGVIDGDEIVLATRSDGTPYIKTVKSDPTLKDTDKDGEDDKIDPEPTTYIKNNTFVYNLGELQKLAKEYKSSSQEEENLRVLSYMRQFSSSYREPNWDKVGGEIDEDFVKYVNTTDIGDYFRNSSFIDAGISYKTADIDVYHLFATLNGLMFYTKNPFEGGDGLVSNATATLKNVGAVFMENMLNDLCGWAGDLQTLMLDARRSFYINGKDTIDPNDENAFYNRILSFMGSSNYSFSFDDLLADIDALNLHKVYLSKDGFFNTPSIEDIFRDYFNGDVTLELNSPSRDNYIEKNNFSTRFKEFQFSGFRANVKNYTRSNIYIGEIPIKVANHKLLEKKHLDEEDTSSPLIFFEKGSIYDKATTRMFIDYIENLYQEERENFY